MTTIARYILIGCWVVFWIYWLAAWFRVKPTRERQRTGPRLVAAWLLGIGIFLIVTADGPRFLPNTDLTALIAIIVSITGLAVALWARWTLAGNWSANVTFKEGHELIQRGPYRFVRHPIYTGFLTMLLADAIGYGRWQGFLGVGFATAGFFVKWRIEEALMTRHFPDQYPPYKARVKALVPWIW